MRQKAATPVTLRKVPEIFCCAFAQRRSRSAWLFVKGMRRSSSKASTCSARPSSVSSRFLALLCLRLPLCDPAEEAGGGGGGAQPTPPKPYKSGAPSPPPPRGRAGGGGGRPPCAAARRTSKKSTQFPPPHTCACPATRRPLRTTADAP